MCFFFCTPDQTETVSSKTKHFLMSIANGFVLAVLEPDSVRAREGITPLLVGGEELEHLKDETWPAGFANWLRSSDPSKGFELAGRTIACNALALNTMIALCSPVLVLAAQLMSVGEEDWALIEASDAKWFAEMIEQGINDDVLIRDNGWSKPAALARAVAGGSPGPIATGRSLEDGFFPNPIAAGWELSPHSDLHGEWERISAEEQWRLAEMGLRARQRVITPATVSKRFHSGVTALDLREAATQILFG